MTKPVYDLLVVGGGINGVGIARDAAGRGFSVLLCERDDLASHTSSWSSKLVHGGLRYLEHGEFRLVRESLKEREVLMQAAPHLIRPLRFILPHHDGLRPSWMLRLGLFLYDHIGGRKLLPSTKTVDLRSSPYGAPLKDEFTKGFEYSDCFADDARLVAVNAVDASRHGAEILTRTALVQAQRENGNWTCRLEGASGDERTVAARAVVNAAGPWVTELFTGIEGAEARKRMRLVKGSHIITTRRFEHDRAYILQNSDNRIIFAIPYLGDSTLIGTTDIPFEGNAAEAAISEEEIDYLLDLANGYFKATCTRDDIRSTYSGVRPLYDDLGKDDVSTVTRDYAFDIDDAKDRAPILSVYGGKLTTYRKLAEHAMESLLPYIGEGSGAWTAGASLPGGEVAFEDFASFREDMHRRYRFLDAATLDRLVSAYGSELPCILGEAADASALGRHYGLGFYECEREHLANTEYAREPADILFRRTKLGLRDHDGALAAALAAAF